MRQPPLRILSVSAEVAPYSKTGGLGDVASALPKALHQPDDETYPIQVTTLTPLYRCVREVLHKRKEEVRDTGVRVSADLGRPRLSRKDLSVGAALWAKTALCTLPRSL